ncbi:CGI-121-domain-containing protein [Amylocystis lapponica]|nr:CGI-121-domain-containing protein [Amylocystis lapponica]
MQSFHYAHFPPEFSCVHLALFTNVSNAEQLRSRLVQASLMNGPDADVQRESVNFAFIDARLICSLLHIQTAVIQAILAAIQGSLRTKTLHSEVLWTLNPTNNITEAIRRYGVSDTTTSLLVVRIAPPDVHDIGARMQAVVSGDLRPIDELNKITDWSAVKKYYKLNSEPLMKAVASNTLQERLAIEEVVVSSVAMKNVTA